jgi:hypothetical protein
MQTVEWPHSQNWVIPMANRNKIGAKAIFDAFDFNLHRDIADLEIQKMYNFFHPLYLTFSTANHNWSMLKSSNISSTRSVTNVIDELTATKIRFWDNSIQMVYPLGSLRHLALFPHRRAVFQSGTVSSRLTAINNLVGEIGSDAALATIKLDIISFQTLLSNAMSGKDEHIIGIDEAISALSAATVGAAEGMYWVHGGMEQKFYKTPSSMDIYFPIDLMTTMTQTDFTFVLTNTNSHKVFKRKFDVLTQKIHGSNLGDGKVKLYFTNGMTSALGIGDLFVIMDSNSIQDIDIALMGYTDAKRHLYCVNLGTTIQSVELYIE